MLNAESAQCIVTDCLKEVLAQSGLAVPQTIDSDTVLVGKDAVLDSLGVVSLVVEIEQKVEQEHSISMVLANDKAMSQKNSPFRTVGLLAEHVLATANEVQAA